MTVLYFTATGNSLQVAKYFGGTIKSIPQLIKNNEYNISDDIVGIVCPTYYLNMPLFVQDFLSKLNIKADYIFILATYGFLSGNAAGAAARILSDRGCEIDYTNTVKMVDNFLLGFDMDNEKNKLPKKNVEGQLERIKKDVLSRKKLLHKAGIFKFISSKTNPAGSDKKKKQNKMSDIDFSVNEKCNLCGVCSKVCPVKNININGSPQYMHQCERCYACIQNCPQNAIHVKGEKSHTRFRNTTVALKELIDSNNQF